MAVFTSVDEAGLRALLSGYTLGELVSFEGISAGIENTNYFVDTTHGQYVLTLFEKLTPTELPYYLGLMRHLADHGVACPAPIPTTSGALFTECAGKPAAFVSRLRGRDTDAPSSAACRLVGAALAKAHLAGASFGLALPNPRGLAWWEQTAPAVTPFLEAPAQALLSQALSDQRAFAQGKDFQACPVGPIHADLFRDNVLFDQLGEAPSLGGFIDFYFAGDGPWAYDLAITVNDWCLQLDDEAKACDRPRLLAMLEGYASVRPWTASERAAWPLFLQAAALRFWLSRLYDWHCPRSAALLKPKDPTHFEAMLRSRCQPLPEWAQLP
ncbi:MAG: homoserine kinase [Burkholderiaceae bacterium]